MGEDSGCAGTQWWGERWVREREEMIQMKMKMKMMEQGGVSGFRCVWQR